MNTLKCYAAGCAKRATIHFIRAEARRVVEAVVLCDEHGTVRLHEHWNRPGRIGPGTPERIGTGVVFDIDDLVLDELNIQDQPNWAGWLELIEVGGARRFGMRVDTFAWVVLSAELQGYQFPRPLTHQAMARLLKAIGARLDYVEIDKVTPGDVYVYEAKLHIEHAGTHVLVDLRPTDAIALALYCGVPIVVSQAVLTMLR